MPKPLEGRVVVTTRPAAQSADLRDRLEALGATVLLAPAVVIEPVEDLRRVDEALQNLARYDWLILTSVNGVNAVADRMKQLERDVADLRSVSLAAIGPVTAERLRELSLEPAVVPEEFVAESLADALGQQNVQGKRCLLLRADIARPALPEALSSMGAVCDEIPIYRTGAPKSLPADAVAQLRAGRVDWVTFTSSSTFRNFHRLLEPDAHDTFGLVKIASIGPITSKTIRDAGFKPTAEANEYTIAGLVDAIRAHVDRSRI